MDNAYNQLNKLPERDISITLLHIIGMTMILLCHISQKIGLYSLGEIFIVGVPLFLFVSGYLSGVKPIKDTGEWLLRKAVRVLLPYLFFMWCVFAIHEIADTAEVSAFQWFFCSIGLQGMNYTYWNMDVFDGIIDYAAVSGTGHFWYITTIMLCYLLTPSLQSLKTVKLSKGWIIIIALTSLAVLTLTMFAGFQFAYIFIYIAVFLTGQHGLRKDNKYYIIVSILALIFTIARFLLRSVLDSTDFYDRTFVLINNGMLAIWIFYTVYFLQSKIPAFFEKLKVGIVRFLENISYHVYLTHYVFLQGGLACSNYISNKLIALIVSLICTFITAILLWLITEKFLNPIIFKKMKENREK